MNEPKKDIIPGSVRCADVFGTVNTLGTVLFVQFYQKNAVVFIMLFLFNSGQSFNCPGSSQRCDPVCVCLIRCEKGLLILIKCKDWIFWTAVYSR